MRGYQLERAQELNGDLGFIVAVLGGVIMLLIVVAALGWKDQPTWQGTGCGPSGDGVLYADRLGDITEVCRDVVAL